MFSRDARPQIPHLLEPTSRFGYPHLSSHLPALPPSQSRNQKVSPFRLTSLLRLERNPGRALQLFRNPNPNSQPPTKHYRYSVKCYDLIICKLGESKRFAEMEQILDQMVQERRFTPKEALFCHVISFYGRAHMPDSATSAFQRIPSFGCYRSIRSFNSVINALLNCRRPDRIADLCGDLDALGLQPDACTYNVWIRASSSSDRAMQLFDEMRRRGLKPTVVTFGTLISALCDDSKLDEAFKLKKEMLKLHDVEPNVYIYTTLIKALCKNGRLDEAIDLKKKIIGLDSAVYSTVIRALFKAGRKGEVVGVMEEMKQDGVKPDAVTYNSMIAGFCDDNDFDAAYEVLGEMERRKIKPDVVSYNTIISAFCREEKWRDALELFEDMPRRGCRPDVISYRMVFDCLCNAGESKDVKFVFDDMMFKGFRPKSVNGFVKLLCEEGDWGMVVDVLCRAAKEMEVVTDEWEMVVRSSLKEGGLLRPRELIDCLRSGCDIQIC